MYLKSAKACRLRLLAVACLILTLILIESAVAGAEGRGGWEKVRDSLLHAGRQTGAFFREMHRSLLHFFRKDAKEAAKEMGKGAVQTGKETNKALKESGKETAKSLKGAAQETKTNLRHMGREIKKEFKGTR